jgi:hypothetical protein
MVRGEFATLLITAPDVLFHATSDFDGFVQTLPNYGVSLVMASASPTPDIEQPSEPTGATADQHTEEGPHHAVGKTSGDLAQLGSLAREWMIRHLAQGDEQAYDRTADAARRTARDVAGAAAATLGGILPHHSPSDPHTIDLGPATHLPDSASTQKEPGAAYGAVPPDGGIHMDHVDHAPSSVAPDLMPRLQQGAQAVFDGAHALLTDHSAEMLERKRLAEDGRHLDAAAGRRVGTLVRAAQATVMRIRTYFTVSAELVRSPIGGYGPGDIVAAIEGMVGRTLDGLKLSKLERIGYVIVAALPYVPSRAVVGGYRRFEPWLRSGDTFSGWDFLMSQLPPWMRTVISDPKDPRYPRSQSFRVVREFGSFLWIPFVLYFSLVTTQAVVTVVRSPQVFRALLDPVVQTRILLVDALIPSATGQPAVVAATVIAVLLSFFAALVVSQAAQIDRLRGALALQMREELPKAHAATAHRVHTTLAQSDLTFGDKMTLSLQHVHEMSLGTAKSIVIPVLKTEALRLALAFPLAVVAVITGVALARLA